MLKVTKQKTKKTKKTTQVLPRTAPPCFFFCFCFFGSLFFFGFCFFSLLFVMQKIFVCWSNVCQRVEFMPQPKVCLHWHAFYVHFAHARGPLFCIFSGETRWGAEKLQTCRHLALTNCMIWWFSSLVPEMYFEKWRFEDWLCLQGCESGSDWWFFHLCGITTCVVCTSSSSRKFFAAFAPRNGSTKQP